MGAPQNQTGEMTSHPQTNSTGDASTVAGVKRSAPEQSTESPAKKQRLGDAVAAPPQGTVESKVYIPAQPGFPAYETPLDLRFPLHWDTQAHFSGLQLHYSDTQPSSPFQTGLLRAHNELRPLGVIFDYGRASGMTHYKGCSPYYFLVDYEEAEDEAWPQIHEKVLETMLKHLGHLEEGQNPVLRYARVEKDDWM